MRDILLLLASLFVLRSQAQATDNVPVCARSCVSETIRSSGCDRFDIACQCQQGSYGDAYKSCLRGSCEPDDARAIGEFSSNSCIIHLRSLLDKGSSATFTASIASSSSPVSAKATGSATLLTSTIPASNRNIATPTSTASQSGSSNEISAASAQSTDPSPSPSTGLSTGAKVGIAVGVVAAFLLGLVLAGLYIWRSRKRKRAPKSATSSPTQDLPATGYSQPHVSMAKFGSETPISPGTPRDGRGSLGQHSAGMGSPAPAYEMGPSEMSTVAAGSHDAERQKPGEIERNSRRMYELP